MQQCQQYWNGTNFKLYVCDRNRLLRKPNKIEKCISIMSSLSDKLKTKLNHWKKFRIIIVRITYLSKRL